MPKATRLNRNLNNQDKLFFTLQRDNPRWGELSPSPPPPTLGGELTRLVAHRVCEGLTDPGNCQTCRHPPKYMRDEKYFQEKEKYMVYMG